MGNRQHVSHDVWSEPCAYKRRSHVLGAAETLLDYSLWCQAGKSHVLENSPPESVASTKRARHPSGEAFDDHTQLCLQLKKDIIYPKAHTAAISRA